MYSRVLRVNRYKLRMDRLAREKGYETAAKMLYEMYEVQHMSLEDIRETLLIPHWTLRKILTEELGITIHPKGGRNNVLIEITPELIEEVSRDGITATARGLGVHPVALRIRLQDWYERTGGSFDKNID